MLFFWILVVHSIAQVRVKFKVITFIVWATFEPQTSLVLSTESGTLFFNLDLFDSRMYHITCWHSENHINDKIGWNNLAIFLFILFHYHSIFSSKSCGTDEKGLQNFDLSNNWCNCSKFTSCDDEWIDKRMWKPFLLCCTVFFI